MTEQEKDNAIPAATVLLLRDEPAFEVLMVERHQDINFAGGAMVFPGGRIDKGDHNPLWPDYCAGLNSIPQEEWAPRIASIREAFEETGILFARRRGQDIFVDDQTAVSFDEWRNIIEKDDARFFELVKQEDFILACDALHLYARWRPPKDFHKRRYDTWFYAAKTPPGQTAREDGNEATDVVWISPHEAIKARETGERRMIFPTARNLEMLAVSASADEVFAAAAARKIERVQPRIIERDGQKYVTIPAEFGYPTTEESVETAFRS